MNIFILIENIHFLFTSAHPPEHDAVVVQGLDLLEGHVELGHALVVLDLGRGDAGGEVLDVEVLSRQPLRLDGALRHFARVAEDVSSLWFKWIFTKKSVG